MSLESKVAYAYSHGKGDAYGNARAVFTEWRENDVGFEAFLAAALAREAWA